MDAAIITTYRCVQACRMCGIWRHPTDPREEFEPGLLLKLPRLAFANVTGGEPFLRDDLDEILAILGRKARRVVVSTNGVLTGRVLELARRHPGVGIRISLEGLPETNDELRGSPGGFGRALETLLGLKALGRRDIGFGMTVSDRNAADLLPLYRKAKALGVEFATAAVHNSFYFHIDTNIIRDPGTVAAAFEDLVREMLREPRPKSWLRAYFNAGLAGYVRGERRPLPCGAGRDIFFLDPAGEIYPCNGLEDRFWKESLGNLHEAAFGSIWRSERAAGVRRRVRGCPKACWMIGTAAPAMRRRPWVPGLWVLERKLVPRGAGRR